MLQPRVELVGTAGPEVPVVDHPVLQVGREVPDAHLADHVEPASPVVVDDGAD